MRSARVIVVGRSVGRSVNLFLYFSVSPHVFSLTVAAVDAKRRYVGMCNGRSAQQESRAALSKNSIFTAGAKNYIQYSYYTRCALIRDRQPTAWDDFARPAEAEATCIRKVSHQIVYGREIQYYKCQVKGSFCEISEEYDVKTTLL